MKCCRVEKLNVFSARNHSIVCAPDNDWFEVDPFAMPPWNPAKLNVIVVDDQPAARVMMKTMLKEMQIHQVFEAGDGREAMRLLESAPEMIDVVICDWNMPSMNGIDVLRQVRASGFEVPFLMVTGRADSESLTEAKEAGVSAYISKPFSPTQLEAKMRVVLTKQERVSR